jgi:hypothetical protein
MLRQTTWDSAEFLELSMDLEGVLVANRLGF